MSRVLNTYKEFNFGTGVGPLDMKIMGIAAAEEIEYSAEAILGSGIPDADIEAAMDIALGTCVVAVPGYLYVGDRELYSYGRKATQITRPVTSSGGISDPYGVGVVYIPLIDIPDGSTLFYPPSEQDPYGSMVENTGAAPILVSAYQSGELTDLFAITGEVIYHDYGMDGQEGYTYDISGEVRSGEVSEWPAYFSPLSRFTVLPSYWRENEPMLALDEFYYDLQYNCIVLYNSGAADYEYIVEYEAANESFKITDIDLNPLVTYPGNSILCISADNDNTVFKEDPSSVHLHTINTAASGERTTITAEVLSERGNRLDNESVRFRIKRKDVGTLSGEVIYNLDEFVEGGPWFLCNSGTISGVIIDEVEFPTGKIYEGDVLIANSNRINGKAYVRSAGYLCSNGDAPDYASGEIPDTAGYEVTVTTDINGMASVDYMFPTTNSSSFDVRIEASIPTMSGANNGSGIVSYVDVVLMSDDETTIYAKDINDLWRTLVVVSGEPYYEGISASGEVSAVGSIARLPISCTSPSSVEVITMSGYVSALYSNTEPSFCSPISVNSGIVENSGTIPSVEDGEVEYYTQYKYIEVEYDSIDFDTGIYIMRYLDHEKITRGDARDTYEL